MKYMITTIILSLSTTLLLAEDAYVKYDVSPHVAPSYKSSKIYMTPNRIGYLRKGESIEVIEKISNGEGKWYHTVRGYVPVASLRYSPNKVLEKKIVVEKSVIPKEELLSETEKDTPSVVAVKEVVVNESKEVEKRENIKPNSVAVVVTTNKEKKNESLFQYFVGGGIGYDFVNTTKNDTAGEIILNDEIDNNGITHNLEAGLKYSQFVVSVNYDYLTMKQINMHNIYGSLDYEFEMFLNPFVGVSLGMTNLNWTQDPLVNSESKDESLSDILYGVQAGVGQIIFNDWYIYTSVGYQMFNFETELVSAPARSLIKHDSKVSIDFGVRYFF